MDGKNKEMTDNHEWQTAKYNMQDDMTQTPTPEQYDWARRVLFKHNRWRLGADKPPTDPKELTEAIEIAMQALRFTAKAFGEPSDGAVDNGVKAYHESGLVGLDDECKSIFIAMRDYIAKECAE